MRREVNALPHGIKGAQAFEFTEKAGQVRRCRMSVRAGMSFNRVVDLYDLAAFAAFFSYRATIKTKPP